jgi:hypothetical protein
VNLRPTAGATPHDPLSHEALVVSPATFLNLYSKTQRTQINEETAWQLESPLRKAKAAIPSGRPKVIAELKELAKEHTAEAIQTLVSIMTNPKFAPAARVSAANALLDRGYGRPAQHITGDVAASYVARLPEPAKNAEEWIASLADAQNKPLLSVPVCRQEEDKANKAKDINGN